MKHVSAETLTTERMIPPGLTQQKCRLIDSNKNVDIKFRSHDAFLE